MSIAAFIIGLLVWFSLPAFLQRRLDAKPFTIVATVSRWIGIGIIIGGVVYGL